MCQIIKLPVANKGFQFNDLVKTTGVICVLISSTPLEDLGTGTPGNLRALPTSSSSLCREK